MAAIEVLGTIGEDVVPDTRSEKHPSSILDVEPPYGPPSSVESEFGGSTDTLRSGINDGEHIKSMVTKLDRTLMPVMILMVIFKVLDVTIIGAAKLDGLEQELNLYGSQFNTAVAVTHVGYMVTQIPSNMLITRVRPSIYLSCCCLFWSVVGTCHAVTQSFGGLLAARLLLGIVDAPFHVGALHLLSSFYSKREMALRGSFLIGAVVIVMAFTGPITAGVFTALGGTYGLAGWRWMYILLGTLGFAVGCLGLFLIPDYPDTSRRGFFLTADECRVAAARNQTERVNTSDDSRRTLKHALIDTVKDKRTWIFTMMLLARNSTGGLGGFYPEIIQSLNIGGSQHENTVGLLLTSPPAVFAVLVCFVVSWSSDRCNERTFHSIVPTLLALMGFVVSAASLDAAARYLSAFLYTAGMVASAPIAMSWQVNVINETAEKKACAIAVTSVLSGIGGIWSPYFFKQNDRPRYLLAFALMAGWTAIDILSCLWLRWELVTMNRKLDESEEETTGVVRAEKNYYML